MEGRKAADDRPLSPTLASALQPQGNSFKSGQSISDMLTNCRIPKEARGRHNMDQRLIFLDRAAKTYTISAPALSAHLMLERASVASDHGIEEPKKGPANACRACGTISIPGVTTKTSIRGVICQGITKRKPSRRSSSSPTKHLETLCLACNRVYRTAISPSKRHSLKDRHTIGVAPKSKVSQSSGGKAPSLSSHSTPPVTSSSSKQRAKARKKGGLHALVERSKQRNQADSASGLDLMDFMKEA